MRIAILILSLVLLVACAKGYREGEPLTGEDLALSQKVSDLLTKVDSLNETLPSSVGSSWKAFKDNVRMFDNNCQRKSCNSLEAREDFNRVRYYAVQLDSVITPNDYPDIYPMWQTIRKDYIDSIGKELGYRIE